MFDRIAQNYAFLLLCESKSHYEEALLKVSINHRLGGGGITLDISALLMLIECPERSSHEAVSSKLCDIHTPTCNAAVTVNKVDLYTVYFK